MITATVRVALWPGDRISPSAREELARLSMQGKADWSAATELLLFGPGDLPQCPGWALLALDSMAMCYALCDGASGQPYLAIFMVLGVDRPALQSIKTEAQRRLEAWIRRGIA